MSDWIIGDEVLGMGDIGLAVLLIGLWFLTGLCWEGVVGWEGKPFDDSLSIFDEVDGTG